MTTSIPALSVHQPWGELIARGRKTIETRTWATRYRGPLVICSTRLEPDPQLCDAFLMPAASLPLKATICLVRLVGCEPMTRHHERAACCEGFPGAVAWIMEEPVRIAEPFAFRGQPGLFRVDVPETTARELGLA
jgi:hypothetical protein